MVICVIDQEFSVLFCHVVNVVEDEHHASSGRKHHLLGVLNSIDLVRESLATGTASCGFCDSLYSCVSDLQITSPHNLLLA